MNDPATPPISLMRPASTIKARFSIKISQLSILGLSALLIAFPFIFGTYYTTLVLPALAYSIALLGLNLLFGYTGLVSFGHALFLAVGGYTAAYATDVFGIINIEVIIMVAICIAIVLALPLGYFCVRYVKVYFAILTMAFSMLFHSFLSKFYHLTGGEEGIRVHRPRLLGMDFGTMDQASYLAGPLYYYVLALFCFSAFFMWRIVRSPFGLHLRALRENSEKANFLAVDILRKRMVAFVIAGVFGAVGGVVLSIPIGLASPSLGYWLQSGDMIFMLLLGGFTNFFGPLVGSFAFVFLQELIKEFTEHWRFVFGLLLGVMVIFFPHGIMGLIDRKRRWSA